MIGVAIKHPAQGYLCNDGAWDMRGENLLLLTDLAKAKKVCKKYRHAVVIEILSFAEGKTLFRQK